VADPIAPDPFFHLAADTGFAIKPAAGTLAVSPTPGDARPSKAAANLSRIVAPDDPAGSLASQAWFYQQARVRVTLSARRVAAGSEATDNTAAELGVRVEPPAGPAATSGDPAGVPESDTGTELVGAAAAALRDTTFDIVINYSGPFLYQSVFTNAALRWEQVITADLPGVLSLFYGTIDDLLIDASVVSIDGVDGVLGQGGPDEFLRGTADASLPDHGTLEIDSADIGGMYSDGTLFGVILHEIGHALGIGTIWDGLGLLNGLTYTGPDALAEYRTLTGNPSETAVPVEDVGGAGSIGSHWRESTFATELMTSIAEPPGVAMPLSRMTVASLSDLGYTVDLGAADPYSLPVCFCRGTLILTDKGELPVEALAVGDRVQTLSGSLKPIRWIGFGRDLVTGKNPLARPIIVRQGALADGVPRRDLYLTHGHALYLDGVLIPVEHLVNHRSILWDDAARVVEYYHIELADHDVLFAEGAPAESYYDAGNRALFHNTRSRSTPAAPQATCAPVLSGGDIVRQMWEKLFARAGGGAETATTADPDLHLLVDGARLDPTSVAGGVYAFSLAVPPANLLHLRSRSAVPSLIGQNRHDHRRLGVAIRQIILSAPGVMTTFDHDSPLFVTGGCHRPEGGHAWTDGNLILPAAIFGHLGNAFLLLVHTRQHAMRYPLTSPVAKAA
jgi:hypothetical protein